MPIGADDARMATRHRRPTSLPICAQASRTRDAPLPPARGLDPVRVGGDGQTALLEKGHTGAPRSRTGSSAWPNRRGPSGSRRCGRSRNRSPSGVVGRVNDARAEHLDDGADHALAGIAADDKRPSVHEVLRRLAVDVRRLLRMRSQCSSRRSSQPGSHQQFASMMPRRSFPGSGCRMPPTVKFISASMHAEQVRQRVDFQASGSGRPRSGTGPAPGRRRGRRPARRASRPRPTPRRTTGRRGSCRGCAAARPCRRGRAP